MRLDEFEMFRVVSDIVCDVDGNVFVFFLYIFGKDLKAI